MTALPERTLLEQASFLRALARGLLADPHAAEDVVQSAYVAALERPPEDAGRPRAWLARVTRNLALDRRRSGSRRRAREEAAARPEAEPAADAAVEREETLRAVTDAVLALDEPYRRTVLLRFYEGLDAAAIAERDGVPVATVRSRQTRALERLRERLDREHGGRAAWSVALAGLLGGERAGLGPAPVGTEAAAAPVAPGAPAAPAAGLAGAVGAIMTTKTKLAAGALALGALALLAHRVTDRLDAPRPGAADAAAVAVPGAVPDGGSAAPVADLRSRPGRADAAALRAAPPGTGSLRLRATWSDGVPAAGVHVKVHAWGSPAPHHTARYVRTDAGGEARVEGLPPGSVGLYADRGGFARAEVAAGRESTASVTLRQGLLVTGCVVDVDGRPVEGAEVWISDYGNTDGGSVGARSGSDGRFALRDVSQGHTVCARLDGHAPSPGFWIEGSPGDTRELELRLQGPGARLDLLVLGPDGDPAPGARVAVAGLEYLRQGVSDDVPVRIPITWNGTADLEGRMTAATLAPGQNEVVVSRLDLAPVRLRLLLAAGTTAQTVRLGAGVTVEGRARDPYGEPLEGVVVRVGGYGDLDARETRTAADGSYTLAAAPRSLDVSATLRDAGSDRLQRLAPDGATVTWDPVVDPGAVLAGRLVDEDGRPLAGWQVNATNARGGAPGTFHGQTTSGADGAFRVVTCPDEELTVTAFENPRTAVFADAVFEGLRPARGAGEPHELRVLHAWRASAWLAGRVLDSGGAPRSAPVRLRHPARVHAHQVWSDEADGTFRIGPLAPGPYALAVADEAAGEHSDRIELELEAGETRDLGDVRLGGPGRLALRIETPAGSGPPNVQVVEPGTRRGRGFFPGRDLPEEIELAAGRYLVELHGGGCLPESHEVAVQSGEVTVLATSLRAGVEVLLRFDAPADALPMEVDLVFRPASGPVWETRAYLSRDSDVPPAFRNLEVVTVPPGDGYALEATAPGGLSGRAVIGAGALAGDPWTGDPTVVVLR